MIEVQPFQIPQPTRRLEFRPYRASDWETVLDYSSRPAFYKYLPIEPPTEASARTFVESAMDTSSEEYRNAISVVICLLGSDEAIGDLRLDIKDGTARIAEIGLGLAPKTWPLRLSDEALIAMMKVGFSAGLSEIVAMVDTQNRGSIKLCNRVGFTHSGIVTQRVQVRGQWCDHIRFKFSASDFDIC